MFLVLIDVCSQLSIPIYYFCTFLVAEIKLCFYAFLNYLAGLTEEVAGLGIMFVFLSYYELAFWSRERLRVGTHDCWAQWLCFVLIKSKQVAAFSLFVGTLSLCVWSRSMIC